METEILNSICNLWSRKFEHGNAAYFIDEEDMNEEWTHISIEDGEVITRKFNPWTVDNDEHSKCDHDFHTQVLFSSSYQKCTKCGEENS